MDDGGEDVGRPSVNMLFADLKPRSRHSVATAIEAVSHEGLTGTLIIQIPSAVGKPTEVFFTNAELKLIPAMGIIQ